MTPDSACERLVESYRERRTIRATSLITTVFGDAIAPRGGVVWLGSLIRALSDFGISERLVRTSVFRLVRDGWLVSKQAGRRSYYRLTDDGRERFNAATHRIYAPPAEDWDGEWTLIFLSALDPDQKEAARREFGWEGFGAISPSVLAHPGPDPAELHHVATRLGMRDALLVMRARAVDSKTVERDAVATAWNLDEINAGYRAFIKQFREASAAVTGGAAPSPRNAFLLRTLLIQEYRRVLLRDPQLPDVLLPPDWQGPDAYRLCSALYRTIHAAADAWLTETMETETGPLPANSTAFYTRFGGLSGRSK